MTIQSETAPAFDAAQTMRLVLLAMLPGIFASVWFFGFGVILNLLLSAMLCGAFEAIALRVRAQNIFEGLKDGSALITAAILALALPPFASGWLIALGCFIAIVLAKHAYGGYGKNLFNPAMAGLAALLVVFPAHFTQWPSAVDGITGATALDVFKQNRADLVADWWRMHNAFGNFGGNGWEWVNGCFLLGGIFLLQRKIFTWHAPVAAMVMLSLLSILFYDGGSSGSGGSPLMHFFSGGTLLGIFFVVTEPVTAPSQKIARMVYGAIIGALTFAIRHWGQYPDGIAFAVLFGNALAPLLDRLYSTLAFERLRKP